MINLVEKYGAEKWSFISSHFPERIGKQCRERWFNHLCPTVNKTAWSKEEEWILFILHNKLGNKWSQLCKYLPGRTDNTIKNHWNSTMRKRIEQLQIEYDEIIKGKNLEEINKIQEELLEKYKAIVEQENKKFFEEKMKNYEKFKNITTDNNQSMFKLKKILLFRTHSKKIKKRGRKKKYLLSEEKSTSSVNNYISNNYSTIKHKTKNKNQISSKAKKKFGTPKIKKLKNTKKKAEPDVEDEKKIFVGKDNIASPPVHKFVISKDNNMDANNKNININNNINIINNIHNENSYNNINIESNGLPFNNNYIFYKNPIFISNNNIFDSQNNKKKAKLDSNDKNSSELKDLSLSTPLKLKQINTPNFTKINNFNITETNKVFQKTNKLFGESNNIYENSAFIKQVPNEPAFPYSGIKTHLYFTSSIKKPIKIISDENQNNLNFNINKDDKKEILRTIENVTPNKIINDKKDSSIKKQNKLNSSAMIVNYPYNDYSPSKNSTPFKVSNTNLDKMFFSGFNTKN